MTKGVRVQAASIFVPELSKLHSSYDAEEAYFFSYKYTVYHANYMHWPAHFMSAFLDQTALCCSKRPEAASIFSPLALFVSIRSVCSLKKALLGSQNGMCVMLTDALIPAYAQFAVHLPYQCPKCSLKCDLG